MKIGIVIIALIAILFLVLFCTTLNQLGEAKTRIKQLEDIKQVQDTRLKEQARKLEAQTTPTTEPVKTLDQEVLEFVVNYSEAQTTYINVLQKILANNYVEYPVFEYQILLESIDK